MAHKGKIHPSSCGCGLFIFLTGTLQKPLFYLNSEPNFHKRSAACSDRKNSSGDAWLHSFPVHGKGTYVIVTRELEFFEHFIQGHLALHLITANIPSEEPFSFLYQIERENKQQTLEQSAVEKQKGSQSMSSWPVISRNYQL